MRARRDRRGPAVKSKQVYWANSTGRRNTSIEEVVDGQASGMDEGDDGQVADEVAGQAVASARCRASVLAADREGLSSEDAAQAVGVSSGGWQPMVSRAWWHADVHARRRSRAGTCALRSARRSRCCVLRARAFARSRRRLDRSPSTISRELRRNAATRGGKLEYRASVAQWKAELVARRPKTAKLAANERAARVRAAAAGR